MGCYITLLSNQEVCESPGNSWQRCWQGMNEVLLKMFMFGCDVIPRCQQVLFWSGLLMTSGQKLYYRKPWLCQLAGMLNTIWLKLVWGHRFNIKGSVLLLNVNDQILSWCCPETSPILNTQHKIKTLHFKTPLVLNSFGFYHAFHFWYHCSSLSHCCK